MRRCRLATCRKEIPKAKESDFYQKAGFCGNDCMADHGIARGRAQIERKKAAVARQERAQTKEARERIKTVAKWRAEAQKACNDYIRARDAGKLCCSCDKPDDGSHQRHASHYRSVKACSSLRYDERNIFASCAQCNAHMSGNLLEYRIRLVRRYGHELVDWLESQNGVTRYTIEDLKRIKQEYKDKLKALRASEDVTHIR